MSAEQGTAPDRDPKDGAPVTETLVLPVQGLDRAARDEAPDRRDKDRWAMFR